MYNMMYYINYILYVHCINNIYIHSDNGIYREKCVSNPYFGNNILLFILFYIFGVEINFIQSKNPTNLYLHLLLYIHIIN